MACFIVPAVEAAVTTVATKILESKEKRGEAFSAHTESETAVLHVPTSEAVGKIPFSRKLKWLNHLLWGGSALLAFEHIWHGEITAAFPFLTAAANPTDTVEMLGEMATAGVTMTVLTTAVWAGMLGVSKLIEKRAEKEALS